jgi:hypothetical protein
MKGPIVLAVVIAAAGSAGAGGRSSLGGWGGPAVAMSHAGKEDHPRVSIGGLGEFGLRLPGVTLCYSLGANVFWGRDPSAQNIYGVDIDNAVGGLVRLPRDVFAVVRFGEGLRVGGPGLRSLFEDGRLRLFIGPELRWSFAEGLAVRGAVTYELNTRGPPDDVSPDTVHFPRRAVVVELGVVLGYFDMHDR